MRQVILKRLKEIEQEYNVKVLFACESGSRAWDIASTDSDWDVRFVYVRPLDNYVTLKNSRDVIEVLEGDLDLVGWDLSKALSLLAKSNPSIVEWLESPIVYIDEPVLFEGTFSEELKEHFFEDLSLLSLAYHYNGLLHRQYKAYWVNKEQRSLKKYFYAIRPIFAIQSILKYKIIPSVNYLDLLDSIKVPEDIQPELDFLLEKKLRSEEAEQNVYLPVLDEFITERVENILTEIDLFKKHYVNPKQNFEEFDRFFKNKVIR